MIFLVRAYLLRRITRMALVMWFVTFAVFVMLRYSGDPATVMLPLDARPEERQALREAMGLDRPLYVQYLIFLSGALRGDLGSSVRYRQPVVALIYERLPATVILSVAGMALAVALGIPLGVIQATRKGSAVDAIGTGVGILGFSMPGFWLGMMLIAVFAVRLRWLPSSGMGGWQHVVLPAVTLALAFLSYIALLVRDGVLEVLTYDYVRTARAKGLRSRAVLYHHALRNTLIPVVSLVGLQTGTLLGGAVITESVFQWPGIGLLALQAIGFRDFPLVQGAVFFLALSVVVMNLLADIAYGVIDPRVRYG
jgi:peptide/nickel transport system permease protein